MSYPINASGELILSRPLSLEQYRKLSAIIAGMYIYLDSYKSMYADSSSNGEYLDDVRAIDKQLKEWDIELSGQIDCSGAERGDIYIIYVKNHKVERVDSILVNAGPSWNKGKS